MKATIFGVGVLLLLIAAGIFVLAPNAMLSNVFGGKPAALFSGNCITFNTVNPSSASQSAPSSWNTNQAQLISSQITLSAPTGTNCQTHPTFSNDVQLSIMCVASCGTAPSQPYGSVCPNCANNPGGVNLPGAGYAFSASFTSGCTASCTTFLNYTWSPVSQNLPSPNTGTIAGEGSYPTGAVIQITFIVEMYTSNGAGMGYNCFGTAGNLWTCSTTVFAKIGGGVTVQPQDFTLAGTPVAGLAAGSTGSSTITVGPLNGFAGTVTLSLACQTSTGSVTTAVNTCTFTPVNIINGGSGSVTLTVGSNCCSGSYQAVVTGISANLQHSVTLPFVVSACNGCTNTPDFTLTSSTPTIIFNVGASGTAVISVAPVNSFAGTVSLTATATGPGGTGTPPAGSTCSIAPASVTLPPQVGSTLTVTATQAASFGCVISGNSGTLTHSLSIFFNSTGIYSSTPLTPIPIPIWLPFGILGGLITVVGLFGSSTNTTTVSSKTRKP